MQDLSTESKKFLIHSNDPASKEQHVHLTEVVTEAQEDEMAC